MITFVVKKNGRNVCKAGVPGDGVLSAILCSVPADHEFGPLTFEVSGLSAKALGEPRCDFDWCHEVLEVGDEISIRIVEAKKCDPPAETRTDPPEKIVLKAKKKSVRRMCKELGWKIVVPKK